IGDIVEKCDNIAIEGKIYKIESRVTKTKDNNRYSIFISDYKSAIQLVAFGNLKSTVDQYGRPRIITDSYLKTFKEGDWVRCLCSFDYDKFNKQEIVGIVKKICKIDFPKKYKRADTAEVKRSELLCHTNMSAFDGTSKIEHIIEKAKLYGWNAIGIVDRSNVHIFPHAAIEAKKTGIKVIYGCEFNVLDNSITLAKNTRDQKLEDAEYVVFDIETTGLYNEVDELIEFGGIKVKNGKIIDTVDFFIKSDKLIPPHLVEKTHITNEMVQEQGRDLVPSLKHIKEWIGDAILIAHNGINFDYRFLNKKMEQHKLPLITNPIIDTMQVSRLINTKLKKHNLGTICRSLKIEYNEEEAHRADFDCKVLYHVWKNQLSEFKKAGINNLTQLAKINTNDFWSKQFADNYVIFYVNGKDSFKPLYKLVSLASTKNLLGSPRVFKSEIKDYRHYFTIANHPFESDVWDNAVNGTKAELEEAINFYDVIYVPSPLHFSHLINRGHFTEKQIKTLIKKIVNTAIELNKKVIAVSDSYYIDPWDSIARRIYISSKLLGGRSHRLFSYNESNEILPDNHLRTTNELLDEFSFLGKDLAKQIVVDNANDFASKFPVGLSPIYDKLCPPIIENAKELMLDFIEKRKHEIYGEKIHPLIEERLQKELDSIVGNNFIVSYWISHLLVKKSNEDGYMVGSRGSVGSSFVAYLLNVSEVNPLPPHYICKKCHHVEFSDAADNGFDLPEKLCPKCGEKMSADGHQIPFETFLGFKGEKTPDIDLNFSGEYQKKAHEYLRQTFGADKSIRSGTISEVKERVAYGYVKAYVEKYMPEKNSDRTYIDWLANICSGVKRTTGQHPGGIIIVPANMEICDFTPYNYPADDKDQDWFTSHFDYHSIESNLYKFDILGHDNPTKMKYLKEVTGFDPVNVPFQDPRVLSLFTKIDELEIKSEDVNGETTGVLGVPEFGTNFVRGILKDAQPKSFADLIRIAGLSHGTDVWLGNAKKLVLENKLSLRDVVCCRDDIMKNLIEHNVGEQIAFSVMESVRKGKGIKENDLVVVKEAKIPDWYIDSCIKIQYLFPKAHAAAYVFDSWRIAWYKLYYPLEFYACYFSIKAEDFDLETCWNGKVSILQRMEKIKGFDESDGRKYADEVKKTDIFKYEVFEVMLEAMARGYKFGKIDLYKSQARYFVLDKKTKTLIPPFITIPSLGEVVANSIVEQRNKKPFKTKEDLINRTKMSITNLNFLNDYGILDGLEEEDQTSLFDL
ncbi:MAG: PolC-type DNA polymerase III, partial [Malacoplasma sp.]|nr:PolC-type DNA polymerase III [Malacoplasma sp.]